MHQLLHPSDRGAEERCSLDLILTNKEGLTRDVRGKGSSDSEMVEFGILKGGRTVKSKLTTLDVRTAGFGPFKGQSPIE